MRHDSAGAIAVLVASAPKQCWSRSFRREFSTAFGLGSLLVHWWVSRRGSGRPLVSHVTLTSLLCGPDSTGWMLAIAPELDPLSCLPAMIAAILAVRAVRFHHALAGWMSTLRGSRHDAPLCAGLYACVTVITSSTWRSSAVSGCSRPACRRLARSVSCVRRLDG